MHHLLRPLLGRLQRLLVRRPRLGGPIGAILYPFELVLVRTGRFSPSTEIIVCEKGASSR